MLEGELPLACKGAGEKTSRAGQGLLIEKQRWHGGRNAGAAGLRILLVLIGADAIANSEARR